MRTDRALSEAIARFAIAEPYRQTEVMTTDAFAAWLKERGIEFRWETIHHLWQLGVLHPVCVLQAAVEAFDADSERFVEVDLGAAVPTYVDLGADVPDNAALAPPDELPDDLAEALLWHPFQLWTFHWLYRLLHLTLLPETFLHGPKAAAKSAQWDAKFRSGTAIRFGNDERQHEYLRVLMLLLAAEPLEHRFFETTVMYHPRAGESFDGYFAWRDSQDVSGLLPDCGLDIEAVTRWYAEIAREGHNTDPLMFSSELVRHMARSKRKMFTGAPLLADDLYEVAEVLRRFLEQYLASDLAARGIVLPEEHTVGFLNPLREVHRINTYIYGSPRTSEADRTVMRRLFRQYGLDPQPRLTWFVEGDTEEGFVRRYAELRRIDLFAAGIELVNLHGKGNLRSDWLRPLLERYQREDHFVCITLDFDGDTENEKLLRQYGREKLISTEFRIWRSDFATANFTLAELAGIAKEAATPREGRAPAMLKPNLSGKAVELNFRQMVARNRDWTVEKTLVKLCGQQQFDLNKGEDFGKAMAEWTSRHGASRAKSDDRDGKRRVVSLFDRLLAAPTSNYHISMRTHRLGRDGRMLPRDRRQRAAALNTASSRALTQSGGQRSAPA